MSTPQAGSRGRMAEQHRIGRPFESASLSLAFDYVRSLFLSGEIKTAAITDLRSRHPGSSSMPLPSIEVMDQSEAELEELYRDLRRFQVYVHEASPTPDQADQSIPLMATIVCMTNASVINCFLATQEES